MNEKIHDDELFLSTIRYYIYHSWILFRV